LAFVASVTIVIALVLLALSGLPGHQAPASNQTLLGEKTIVFVGDQSGIAGETLVILKARYSGPLVEITELAGLSEAATKVNASSLVLFNSEWLVGKVGEVALTDFFKSVLPTQVKIVALGGPTSLLFDALEPARNGIFAEGRNPAYDNPQLAGYALKQATSPNGTISYGDTILIGYPESALSAADSVSNWE